MNFKGCIYIPVTRYYPSFHSRSSLHPQPSLSLSLPSLSLSPSLSLFLSISQRPLSCVCFNLMPFVYTRGPCSSRCDTIVHPLPVHICDTAILYAKIKKKINKWTGFNFDEAYDTLVCFGLVLPDIKLNLCG